MPITTVLILVCVGLVLFGLVGFLYYCDMSTRKIQKAAQEAEKKNKK